MKPIKFKHCNTTIAEGQDQYNTIHALKLEGEEGNMVTCWKLSIWERLVLLFTGVIWRNDMTFNRDYTPTFMSVDRLEVYRHPDDLSGGELWDYKIERIRETPIERLDTCMIDTNICLNPYDEMRRVEYNDVVKERLDKKKLMASLVEGLKNKKNEDNK